MVIALALVLGGAALLYVGAEALVRGAAALALRLGMTPLAIGLTVVSFGTSTPELVVSLQAGVNGQGALAVGNVIGSNISNIALILALSALVSPLAVHARLIRFDLPILLLASIGLTFLLWDGRLGRVEGAVLVGGLVAYTAFTFHALRVAGAPVRNEDGEAASRPTRSAFLEVGMVISGLFFLGAGARLMVDGAVTVAGAAGMSEAAIGITVVAIGTSLPELATSLLAAIRRQGDIAVGNVVGSSIFNLLGILGVAALARPIVAPGIHPLDLLVMVAAALVLVPTMLSARRIGRIEGTLMLCGYAAYVVHLLQR